MKPEEIFAEEANRLKQGLQEWANEGSLPPERSAALASLVHQSMAVPARTPPPARIKGRLRWWAGAAAVAAATFLLLSAASPMARVWATETFPALARYIGLESQAEQGWAWAEEHGAFQEILAVAEDKGYTFRVHRVLSDPSQTTIIYSVEGPEPKEPRFTTGRWDAIRFNGKDFVRRMSGNDRMIDGVLVGSIEVDPLPEESGTMTIALEQIGDLKGRWQLSFPVTRAPLTELTRLVPVYQVIDLGEVQIQVREVEIIPTQTVLHLRYQGPVPGPQISPQKVELLTPSGLINPRGGNARGGSDQKGNETYNYQLFFQPLPADTTEVTLRIRSVDTVLRDQRLTLPLQPGATAGVADLPRVTVLAVDDKRAVIEWPHDHDGVSPYDDWWVIDDRGEPHRASRYGGTGGATSEKGAPVEAQPPGKVSLMTLNVNWDKLPRGRKPVALEAREVGHRIEGNWELRIPLK